MVRQTLMADPIEKFRSDFEKHYDKILSEQARGNDIIHKEFDEIQRYSKSLESRKDDKKYSVKEGRRSGHEMMNRYRDILPFDSTRVKLRNAPYINASWISKKEYIATQGPKPDTVRMFWEMVIQYKIEIIVMLCKLKEINNRNYYTNGAAPPMKEKCAEYWPQQTNTNKHIDGSDKLEDICVTLKSEDNSEGFVVRQMDVKNRNGIHNVLQFQMLHWPDYGVPKDRDEVIKLIDSIRNRATTKSPILLHCSAGVGRTGTIIALDRVKQMLAAKSIPKHFSVKSMVKELREQRMKMVQSEDQYRFLYEMIDYILFGNSRRNRPNSSNRPSSGRPTSVSIRKPYGNEPSAMAKAMSLQSPNRQMARRSLKSDNRPKSEYAVNRHTRANLRKSRSVEKISNGVGEQKVISPDGRADVNLPDLSSRSRRPARRNGMKNNSRSNSREGHLNPTNTRKTASESSSDIDFNSGPGKCLETDNSTSNSESKPLPTVKSKPKQRKEIVKLKETPKSKSSLFSLSFFNRTPKKPQEQKVQKSKNRKDSDKTAANNVSASFRQPSPTPESIAGSDIVNQSADSSRSDTSIKNSAQSSQNPPKPNIIGKMWRTPKKNKPNSSTASPHSTRKKGKSKSASSSR